MKLTVSLFPLLVLISVAAFVAPASAVTNLNGEQPQPQILPGWVTVQFEDDVDLTVAAKSFGRVSFGLPSLDAVLADLAVSDYRAIFPWRTEKPKANSGMHDLTRYYELAFPEDADVRAVVRELLQNPHVRTAYPVWLMPLRATPNDPYWSNQWALEPPGPDPNFYTAWDIETGSDTVIFGCIDSGVNYNHPDLAPNIWVNPGEDLDGDGVVFDTDDLNGIDDDGNGIVDDLIGYDFLTNAGAVWPGEDGSVRDPDPNDFNGHGTHVAGIAAAATNNGIAVAGAAGGWFGGNKAFRGARIMCLRAGYTASNGNGYVNSNDCAAATDYAVMMGADVINASWGGSTTSAVAAANAVAAGVTYCHAAGNDNAEWPDEIDYQAGVLSVASVGASSDVKASSSNYGYWIDVCAPGEQILSTYSDEYTPTTAYLWGTSMASPMVAGQALLIRSAMPSLTKSQVDSLIIVTADPVEYANAPQYHYKLGSGRINAWKSLLGLASAKFTADVTSANVPFTTNFTDLSPYSPTAWQWFFGTGDQSTEQNPSFEYLQPGFYDVSLIVDDSSSMGPGEEHLRRFIWARADTMALDSLEVDLGTQAVIPVYLHNTGFISDIKFPFQLENHLSRKIEFDSFSVAGLRTEYFAYKSMIASNPTQQQFTISMRPTLVGTPDYLPPDTGAILKLFVTVKSTAEPDQLVTIDTATVGSNSPTVVTPFGNYWPEFSAGKILARACDRGDANCDGQIKISDLTMIISYMFAGGPSPDVRGGDVNGDGVISIADVTYLVSYLFQGGPPPPTK